MNTTNEITVKDAQEVGAGMVFLGNMTAEQKKEALKQLQAEEKAEKEKKKADKQAYKDMQNEFLAKHIDGLVDRQNSMETLVANIFKDYAPILALKANVFGEDIHDQESHTYTNPDGLSSISIGHNITISFDGTEGAGIAKIKSFLFSLQSDDEVAVKLHKAVTVLLRPNRKTGMLNPASIIQLNQMRDEFQSNAFNEGLDIIIEAQNRVKGSMYVSGWKHVEIEPGRTKKIEFRFTI
ncbi:hypothetical protein [Flavobacterium cerinum]|uniref:DUF3164 family protein n=1 Tax=Flavobacterium cerinum TaxID=2502784 RepID=A0A3S3QLG0_9FLAO|nr:hypothetical protein [Flavobacterium cerinum]RWW91839.1 hypothetical protein EPI11_17510 [Flavobacterium cerinum]